MQRNHWLAKIGFSSLQNKVNSGKHGDQHKNIANKAKFSETSQMTYLRIHTALALLFLVFSAQSVAAFFCGPENSPGSIIVSVNATDQTCSDTDTLSFLAKNGHQITVTTDATSGNATVAIQVIENGLVKNTTDAALTLVCGNFGQASQTVSYNLTATSVFANFSLPGLSADCSLSYLDDNGYTVFHDFSANRGNFVGDPVTRSFVGGFYVENGWFDQVAPDVTLSGLAGIAAEPVTISVVFSEDVTGFSAADVSLGNLILDNFTAISAIEYEFDVTAIAAGQATISIAAGVSIDGSGNGNTVSNTLNVTVDVTPPDVVITGFPAQITGAEIFDATITFSGPVTGFDAADITISGGSITNLTGGDTVFTATISATGLGDVAMVIAADVATNNLGIGNNQSNTVTAIDASPARTRAIIAQYLQTRANALLANQPDLAAFLNETRRPRFRADLTGQGGDFAYASGNNPIWSQVNANWTTNSGATSAYVFGAFGGYSKISENLLLGGMLQFDFASESNGAAIIEGQGWLLGPYFVAKLPDQPLYFEGSLLYGQTANSISPLGSFTDQFTTERWLATLGVSGQIERGSLTLTPFLDAKYTSDAQDSYVDGLGNVVEAQTIGLAQAAAGLDFELDLNSATTVNGGVSGLWTYSTSPIAPPSLEGGRARVDLGITRQFSDNSAIGLSGFYDGIGADDFESYGAELFFSSSF